jgi:hypothetical protein
MHCSPQQPATFVCRLQARLEYFLSGCAPEKMLLRPPVANTIVLKAELRCLLWNKALARMRPWAINTHSRYIVHIVCLGCLMLTF